MVVKRLMTAQFWVSKVEVVEVRHGTVWGGGLIFSGTKPLWNSRSMRGGGGSYGPFQNGPEQELVLFQNKFSFLV